MRCVRHLIRLTQVRCAPGGVAAAGPDHCRMPRYAARAADTMSALGCLCYNGRRRLCQPVDEAICCEEDFMYTRMYLTAPQNSTWTEQSAPWRRWTHSRLGRRMDSGSPAGPRLRSHKDDLQMGQPFIMPFLTAFHRVPFSPDHSTRTIADQRMMSMSQQGMTDEGVVHLGRRPAGAGSAGQRQDVPRKRIQQDQLRRSAAGLLSSVL